MLNIKEKIKSKFGRSSNLDEQKDASSDKFSEKKKKKKIKKIPYNPSNIFTELYLTNLIPLIGIMFTSWTAETVILFFIIDGFILGIFHAIKIYRNKNPIAYTFDGKEYVNNEPHIRYKVLKDFLIIYFISITAYSVLVLFPIFNILNISRDFTFNFLFIIGIFATILAKFIDLTLNYIKGKENKIYQIGYMKWSVYPRFVLGQLTLLVGLPFGYYISITNYTFFIILKGIAEYMLSWSVVIMRTQYHEKLNIQKQEVR